MYTSIPFRNCSNSLLHGNRTGETDLRIRVQARDVPPTTGAVVTQNDVHSRLHCKLVHDSFTIGFDAYQDSRLQTQDSFKQTASIPQLSLHRGQVCRHIQRVCEAFSTHTFSNAVFPGLFYISVIFLFTIGHSGITIASKIFPLRPKSPGQGPNGVTSTIVVFEV